MQAYLGYHEGYRNQHRTQSLRDPDFNSFRDIPRMEIVGSEGSSIFNVGGGGWGRNFFTVLPEAIPFSFTPVACEGFSFSTSPPTFSNLFFWGGGMVIIAILTGVR